MVDLQVFEFLLTGFFSDTYEVKLEKDSLVIKHSDFHHIPVESEAVTILDCANWEALVSFLKHSKWKKRYDSDILDGFQWELKVRGSGLKLSSYGSNNYPADFPAFLRLLNEVIAEAGVVISK